jgi:hypothetical protein
LVFWLVLIAATLASTGFDDLTVRIAIFVSIAAGAIYMVRADLGNPVTWFVPVFGLYSLSAPLVYLLEHGAGDRAIVSSAVWLETLALVAFVLGQGRLNGGALRKDGPPVRNVDTTFRRLAVWLRPLFLASFCITAVFVSFVFRTDFGSKQELVRSDSPLFKLQFGFSLLLLAWFGLMVARLIRTQRVPWGGWFAGAAWFGVASVLSSERDLLLRFGLISVVLWHFFVRPLRTWQVAMGGVLGIALVGLLGVWKLQKATGHGTVSAHALLENTLRGEFHSASDNLIVLLDGFEAGSVEYKLGETFADDFGRVFASSSIFGDRDAMQNGASWFNRTFFESRYLRGGGRGFSLVAEGYLNFGPVGVVGLFLLLSLALGGLHRRTSSVSGGLLYALIVPGVVYAIRMDVSVLLSYSVKQIAAPAVLMTVCSGFLRLGRRASTRRVAHAAPETGATAMRAT